MSLCDRAYIVIFTLWCAFGQCRGAESVRLTNYGKVKGIVERYRHQLIEKFFGIPYAKAPVGRLRLEVRSNFEEKNARPHLFLVCPI